MGGASGLLCGNQAKRVSFNGSSAGVSVPQSAKPGLFSVGEPVSFFTGVAGVVAGTGSLVTRRWNGKGGSRRWGPGIGGASVERVSAPLHSGETDPGWCGAGVFW